MTNRQKSPTLKMPLPVTNHSNTVSLAGQEPTPLVVILGPTAVGKSDCALQVAENFPSEIVSADSRLLYRGMDIGTAKPSQEERRRVQHHLVDVADPDQTWSLAVYQRRANLAISDIANRKKLPLLVGGTGQYIRAVTQGWIIPMAPPHSALRGALESWSLVTGGEGLHKRLRVIDPDAAALIEPQNLRRTIRALEVIFTTGRRFSEQRTRVASPYQQLMIGLYRPRDELYSRIDVRIEGMFASGFVEEVKSLLEAGYSPELPSMSAIGYQQVVNYLQGKISLQEAKIEIKRATRVFVRRQANWFKMDDPNIHWFNAGENHFDLIRSRIAHFLLGFKRN